MRAPEPGDREHLLPLRVYYEDTDAAGVVYHASYLRYAERARTEYLRALGFDQRRMLAENGVVFAVRRCVVDFMRPARLDDELLIRTRVEGPARAKLTARQVVVRGGEDLARLEVLLACVDRDGRPARLPEAVRLALQGRATEAVTTD